MSRLWIVLLLISAVVLVGCGASGGGGDAAAAVEDYLQAIVDKEPDTVVNLSCAAWEVDARTEVDSFQAVDVTLRDPACTVTGTDGDATLVACTGALVTTYDGEDQELDLSRRTYRVVNEGGEWRMCGYQE
jgi:hypothetical protein